MKTLNPKQIIGSERKWYVVDATGQTLGRLATVIATTLRGKNKVAFAAHVDNGDYVIVLNAEKIEVTGTKETTKLYRSHSQFMGGLKEVPLARMRAKKPEMILEHAVKGMLPKTKHQEAMLGRLKLIVGSTHKYEAQKPETLNIA
jgi:large subunit ribosomal protein L13